MKNVKRILFSISTALILSLSSTIGAFADDYSNYNRNNAVSYANSWATSPNSAFKNYIYDGGDCTNFVSQCVYAGGLPETSSWYYYGSKNVSASWIMAQSFRDYYKNKVYDNTVLTNSIAQVTWASSLYSKLWPGDVIQYSHANGTMLHSQIITGYDSGSKSTYFAQHGADSYNYFYKDGNLKYYLQGRPASDTIYLCRIKSGA